MRLVCDRRWGLRARQCRPVSQFGGVQVGQLKTFRGLRESTGLVGPHHISSGASDPALLPPLGVDALVHSTNGSGLGRTLLHVTLFKCGAWLALWVSGAPLFQLLLVFILVAALCREHFAAAVFGSALPPITDLFLLSFFPLLHLYLVADSAPHFHPGTIGRGTGQAEWERDCL